MAKTDEAFWRRKVSVTAESLDYKSGCKLFHYIQTEFDIFTLCMFSDKGRGAKLAGENMNFLKRYAIIRSAKTSMNRMN